MKRVAVDPESESTGTFIVGNKYMYRGPKCREYKSGKLYEFLCTIKCACGCTGCKLLFRGERGRLPFVDDTPFLATIDGKVKKVMPPLSNGSGSYDWYSEEEMAVLRNSEDGDLLELDVDLD